MIFELVLPCYNEARSLETLIRRAQAAALEYGLTTHSFRLVLVENGSKDDSQQVLNQLSQGELKDWFRVVSVSNNQGYGFGLWSGLKTCTADFVGWSHADQQCDPKDAFLALSLLRVKSGNHLIKGQRFGRDWKDRMVTFVFEGLARLLLRVNLQEINAQPKVFPGVLLKQIVQPPNDFAFDLYFLYRALKADYKIESIPVQFPPRVHGLSNWSSNFFSRYRHIRNMIRYIWHLSIGERN